GGERGRANLPIKAPPGAAVSQRRPADDGGREVQLERYQGAGAQTLKDHVQEIEIVDPLTVRFHLKAPWPDFMTFYGKKYLTEIGDDGFKKHPVGVGPYK